MERTLPPAAAARRHGTLRLALGALAALALLPYAALAASAAPAPACSGDAPAWVTMEVEAVRLQSGEAVEFVEVDRAGCVTTRYGSMDVRAGTYRRQMDEAQRAELEKLITATGVDRLDANNLRKRIADSDAQRAKSSAGKLAGVVIADGDLVRLSIDTGTRRNLVVWSAPAQEAALRPGTTELQSLVQFLQAVQEVGGHPAKQKIAGAKP